MSDRPDGAELLALARAVLLEELLPEMPESRRYETLMIASAMAMARRELERSPAESDGETLRRLAAEVRAGRRDADRDTYSALLDACRSRVRVSQPKALTQVERASE